jgi:hypothetical protein
VTEAILDAELPIIDPHRHLWDRHSLLALFAGTAARFYRLEGFA